MKRARPPRRPATQDELKAAFENSMKPRTTVKQISPFVFLVTRRKPRRKRTKV